MLYLDYEQAKAKYRNAQIIYNDILDEQTELFTKYLPSAVRYDQEKVSGGAAVGDAFSSYMIKKEQLRIDERLAEVEELLEAREKQLIKALDKLKASKNTIDIIYMKKYVLGLRVTRIAREMSYSESHIYRFLKEIETAIQRAIDDDIITHNRTAIQSDFPDGGTRVIFRTRIPKDDKK